MITRLLLLCPSALNCSLAPRSSAPQLCMATVYSLLYGALGRKITGEAKTA